MKNKILITLGIFVTLSILNLFITAAIYWTLIGNALPDETSIPQLIQLMGIVEVVVLLLAIPTFLILIKLKK